MLVGSLADVVPVGAESNAVAMGAVDGEKETKVADCSPGSDY